MADDLKNYQRDANAKVRERLARVRTYADARAAAGECTRVVRQAYEEAERRLAGGVVNWLSELGTGASAATTAEAKERLDLANQELSNQYRAIERGPGDQPIPSQLWEPLRRAIATAYGEAFGVLATAAAFDWSLSSVLREGTAEALKTSAPWAAGLVVIVVLFLAWRLTR